MLSSETQVFHLISVDHNTGTAAGASTLHGVLPAQHQYFLLLHCEGSGRGAHHSVTMQGGSRHTPMKSTTLGCRMAATMLTCTQQPR